MSTFLHPEVPGPRCGPEELADFWEIQCLRSGTDKASLSLVRHAWEQSQEENASDDMEEDIEAEGSYDDALQEIQCRIDMMGTQYPFSLAKGRTTLVLKRTRHGLYRFLLLATRLPDKQRVLHGINAKSLFESISAEVLRTYLGKNARSACVGASTGDEAGFEARLRALCEEVGEFQVRPDFKTHTQSGDRGLDCVAWIPFKDARPGQLMLWGQAKTGVGWRDTLFELQPETFGKNWLHPPPRVLPVRAFLVTERAEAGRWDEFQNNAGIFLDRCRVMQFEAHLPTGLLREVASWSEAAVKELDRFLEN